MDCERCTEDLTAYLDGELTQAKASDVKTHLALCETCREEYRSLEVSARFVEAHCTDIEIRPEAWNVVRARISAMPSASPAPGLYQWLITNPWWGATATALATVALILGFWGYTRHQAEQKDLTQYMAKYIETREAQEKSPRILVRAPGGSAVEAEIHPEYEDNPFVTVSSTADSNPFKPEDQ